MGKIIYYILLTILLVSGGEERADIPAVYMNPLYAKFMNGEITVQNPFALDMDEYSQYLGFYDDLEYETEFEDVNKSFALQDVNNDGKEELLYKMESHPSVLIYILGIVEEELVCFDVFETHTSSMAYVVYENGYVWFGSPDREEYYTFDAKGEFTDIHNVENIDLTEEDGWIRVTWISCKDVIFKEEAKQVEMDYYAFENTMTSIEWQAFSEYLPVLDAGEEFYWTDGWIDEQRGKVSLSEFYAEALPVYEEPDYQYEIEEVAVIDLDQDGICEVVLSGLYPGGHYLVLHKEGDDFYGIDFVYRGFLTLQNNGVYTGSGGAGSNGLFKLSFENGMFVETMLGGMDDFVYHIGDEEVDYDTLMEWWDEMHVGDVTWYKSHY